MSAFNLGIIFTAQDLATGKIDQLSRSFNNLDATVQASHANFGKHVAAFSAGMAIMSTGAKIAALPLSFVQTAADFQKSMAAMGAATGYPEDQMAKLEKKAIDLGVATQFDPKQVVDAMKQLGSSGLSAAQTLQATDAAVSLAGASMGQLGMQGAAGTVVAGLKAFNLEATKSMKVADMMTRATQVSNITFPEMERVISGAGGAAREANQDMATMLATVGLFKLQGGTARNAAQKFRMALESMPKASAEKGFAAIGMSVTDIMKNGKFIALPDALDKIKKGLEGIKGTDLNDKAKQQKQALMKIFGQNGAELFNRMMNSTFTDTAGVVHKGTNAMRANIEDFRKTLGTSQKANENYLHTLPGIIDLLTGTMETIKLVLGQSLIKDVGNVLDFFLNKVLNKVLKFLQESPRFTAFLTKALLGIGTTLMIVGGLIAGFSGFALLKIMFLTAGISITGSLAAIGSALATAFLPVTIATALIVGAVLAWKSNLGGFRDFVMGFINNVKTWFSLFSSAFTESFDLSGIMQTAQPVIQVLKEVFAGLSEAVFEVLDTFGMFKSAGDFSQAAASGERLGSMLNDILVPAIQIGGAILVGFIKVVTWLVQKFGGMSDGMQNFVLTIIAIFNPFIGIPLLVMKNWEKLTGLASSLQVPFEFIGALFTGLVDAVLNWPQSFENSKNLVVEIFNSMKDGAVNAFNGFLDFMAALPGMILNFVLNIPGYIIGSIVVIGILFWEGFKAIVGFAAQAFDAVGQIIMGIPGFAMSAATFLWNGFMNSFNLIVGFGSYAVTAIIGFFTSLPSVLYGLAMSAYVYVSQQFMMMGTAASMIVGNIIGFFTSLPSRLAEIASSAAKGFIDALSNGIRSQAERIRQQVESMVRRMRELLPGSDAKTGPLSDLTHSGSMLPRTFALGMEKTMSEPADKMEDSLNVRPQTVTQTVANIIPQQATQGNDDVVQALAVLAQAISEGNSRPIIAKLMMDKQVLSEATMEVENDETRRSFTYG